MSKPRSDLKPNTLDYENLPLVTSNGFREYDARWLFGKEINLLGVQALGLGLGTYLHEVGAPKVVTGHDYRSYSLSIKQALVLGLMNAGCDVLDVGLATTPVSYYAQFALDVPAVAMVTASHNENGWTGVKMGAAKPLTFGPDEIGRLKQIVLGGEGRVRTGGRYTFVENFREKYLEAVTSGHKLSRPIKVVAACGNGTAGAFAPEALRRIGADVIPMDAELDYTFPKYNPNPEDLHMLHAMADAVREHKAELCLGFDGDGDRCGVVDDMGEEIFADKVGVLLARDLSQSIPNAQFVVDVKSTGIYLMDPVLKKNGVKVDYWKTGHSYIKRRTAELKAVAGFEKSGHYFFNPPVGRGYDDAIIAAIAILEMLDRAGGKKMSQLEATLPKTWSSPTMAPYCADDAKYNVVAAITKEYEDLKAQGQKVLGQNIASIVTVNGVRVTLEDGTWCLVRASSNKPSLVVVVESPTSEANMRAIFADLDGRLSKHKDVGEYDQKI
ncbi:MAG: phosphomannomutase/phosphoglucomutase [Alphaproteobacteria bacterium]|nr:phosphomannomutase/phosphoglucomutase [Alphaproteobacteria bacterium]MDE1987204.1 phosphomannomutase/phosphoglucomutase [Alphaproteobacteria bacterium]MDE2264776.1 phosphomannomutase/phosphoglucomutase [Alphaproteobacteria bacterium]MDE2500949.1 phosphomannomutase/phosphoglucomutase [Alphaproteobacteria bacterium]